MAILFLMALIVIGILLFVPFHFPVMASGTDQEHELTIIAHRGASGLAPENTIPAIDLALKSGADYIEVDVHLSKDKRLVVMHDRTVNRTTDGEGRISDLEWSYIQTLDAGCWFEARYNDTAVPLLEEIIQKVNGKAKLLIEIKSGEHPAIADEVFRLIEDQQATDWCEIQSFSDEILEYIHNRYPAIKLHKLFFFKFRFLPWIFDGSISRFSFKKYSYIQAFNFHHSFTNKGFLRQVHDGGKKANAWGCTKENSCKTKNMNLWDGIITNFPGRYSQNRKN